MFGVRARMKGNLTLFYGVIFWANIYYRIKNQVTFFKKHTQMICIWEKNYF